MANEDPRKTGVKTTVSLCLPSQYFDQETGFHYNYFRAYITDLGHYSQSDSIGLSGGWNTFVYVEGNSLRWSDLLGLTVLCPQSPPINNPIWKPYNSSKPSAGTFFLLWLYKLYRVPSSRTK